MSATSTEPTPEQWFAYLNAALAHALLRPFVGRRYLGIVNAGEQFEIVFSNPDGDDPDGEPPRNVIGLRKDDSEDSHHGWKHHYDNVDDPETYVAEKGIRIEGEWVIHPLPGWNDPTNT